jgi:GT2 family glycosyltransferase
MKVAHPMSPLVSILIPAYNAQDWIAASIQSAIDQTWPRKEIVVVDDGSTDDTLSIARRFASDYVTVIAQPNRGAAAARNTAYSISKGDYIQWLDADDLLATDKIARQLDAAESVGGGRRRLLSSAWGQFLHRPWKARFIATDLWQALPPVDWLLVKMEQGAYMQTSTWLVSRELADAAGAWDTRLALDDDGEYFSRVVLASEGVDFVAPAKVFYRSRLDSLSYVGASSRKLEANFLAAQLQITQIRSIEDSPRVRSACVKMLQRQLALYALTRPDLMEASRELAASLDGRLTAPRASPKYRWIEATCGLATANRTQLAYNRWKLMLQGAWDRWMWHLNVGSPGPQLGR